MRSSTAVEDSLQYRLWTILSYDCNLEQLHITVFSLAYDGTMWALMSIVQVECKAPNLLGYSKAEVVGQHVVSASP